MKEVIVYGKPNCPFCDKAKNILDENDVTFTYIDITTDEQAAVFLKTNNHSTVPQIYIDGNYHGESESAKTVGAAGNRVTKRDGTLEVINLDKIHKVVAWAAEGLDVSVSQVELDSHLKFYDKITTEDIQKTLIKSAADLISVGYPDYQYMAARLVVFNLRKKVYGTFTPPTLLEHVNKNTGKGVYDKHILQDYSESEFEELNKHIKHDNDMKFAYAGIMQMEGKYLVQNRVTKEVYETPQFLYMLVGMCLFSKYESKKRMKYVKAFYDETSKFKLSLPTPIMGGVRTPTRQFSSCVLIESGDNLDSINASSAAIVKYISQRAGIGINGGRIRALGSEIRKGEAIHTGVIPFWKMFQSAVKSCSQGGIRGGAATMFYPIWHLEVESLLVLKNNKGVEENRIRHLDYGIQLNKLMYQRLISGGNITLFSPSDVEGLYDAFFEDQDEFEKLYLQYEQDTSIRKKVIKSVDLFSLMMQERASTGRIYIQNVDHCNTNSPFDSKVAPIRQSNLCVAPETQILTRNGYVPIVEAEGEVLDIWNGEDWSNVLVQKTGENQQLLKVETSAGQSLECTPYHRWYIFDGYGRPYKEVRTNELKIGDKLAKFELPVIEGDKTFKSPYSNGFYSGDGCYHRGRGIIYLYHEKRDLLPFIYTDDNTSISDDQLQKRIIIRYRDSFLKEKFFVPNSDYSIETRLNWLAGYLDADGCVYRNGTNEALTACSINKEFLQDIQMMLQTLGVSCKISNFAEEGMKPLPANDGTGELKRFFCQKSYRLLITSRDTQVLLNLGLKCNRLKVEKRNPQRDAKQFNKVVSITDEGRTDDTYCFREEKRGMGMFNGILTGQCLEIALPTKPLNNVEDGHGEVALCTLAAFNLGVIKNNAELEHTADVAVRALDALLDYQNYPLPAARRSSMGRRTLGLGVINYANWLAKQGFKYSDDKGNNATHELFEAIQYYCLKASNNLAKEVGACPYFNETTYSKGILPIDRYKKDVDLVHGAELLMDWNTLRTDIRLHGLRNSTVTAIAPTETSAQVSNATNGIEPPRGYVSVKSSKDGILRQVVPDIRKLKNAYELLWDIPDNKGYLDKVGIIQKFVDQAISANTNYDPSKFSDGKVSLQVMLQDLLYAYKVGAKTLYYHNTRDGSSTSQDEVVEVEDESCSGGACKI